MENIYNTIEEALEDLKKGKIIIVTDDEDRENEGDLICAAEFATTENINFMATYAKGLICMPMNKYFTDKLLLNQMVQKNTDNHETAFTVSIDHIETTTGISAIERSITALKVVDDKSKPEDFRRPGHMFPLLSKDGGVLVRKGHTEATVDLMRIAGLKECGLCCEIMKDNGDMMRRDDLLKFAKEHNRYIKVIVDGKPLTLIQDGKIKVTECLKNGISANELMFKLRSNGIYEVQNVKRAILEQNGQLTIIEFGGENIKYPIIVDGQANYDVLDIINKNEEWLETKILENGFNKITEVYLGEYISGELKLYGYQE